MLSSKNSLLAELFTAAAREFFGPVIEPACFSKIIFLKALASSSPLLPKISFAAEFADWSMPSRFFVGDSGSSVLKLLYLVARCKSAGLGLYTIYLSSNLIN